MYIRNALCVEYFHYIYKRTGESRSLQCYDVVEQLYTPTLRIVHTWLVQYKDTDELRHNADFGQRNHV